jgi:hypothetical protein
MGPALPPVLANLLDVVWSSYQGIEVLFEAFGQRKPGIGIDSQPLEYRRQRL